MTDRPVAIVTGSAAGIGLATCRALDSAGYEVVGADISTGCDVGSEEAVLELLRSTVERLGRLDVVVNNAGIGRHNPLTEVRTDDLDAMWRVNVRGLVLMCREAFRHFVASGTRGQIVNVVSTAGLRGEPGESVYCATKFAVRGFTEAIAEEGRVHGIRVHGIYPAGVDTAFWTLATAAGPGVDTAAAFLRPDDVAAAITIAVTSPAHLHQPEVVVRAMADADIERIAAKLDRFRQ